MKKYTIKLLLSIFIATVFYAISSGSVKNIACAKSWTTCPGAGGVPVSDIYPGVSSIDSVGLNFKITGKGIPSGQTFRIDVNANNGVCNYVKCLKRSDSTTTTAFDGNSALGNIQTIGCSDGSCNDNLTVNAYFNGGTFSGTCQVYAGDGTPTLLLNNATQSDNISNRNGTEMSFFFYFDCSVPATPTPTPPACVVPGTPAPVVTCSGCTK